MTDKIHGDLIPGIEGGDENTVLTPDEYLIIKEILERVPEGNRNTGWIIHGISQGDGTMQDLDLDSRDFNRLHDTIKKVYQTLKEKKKKITPDQRSGMYDIMQSRPSQRAAAPPPAGGNMYSMYGGGYMNGARKKSKRRKSKRRNSKRRNSKRRKTNKRKSNRKSNQRS